MPTRNVLMTTWAKYSDTAVMHTHLLHVVGCSYNVVCLVVTYQSLQRHVQRVSLMTCAFDM